MVEDQYITQRTRTSRSVVLRRRNSDINFNCNDLSNNNCIKFEQFHSPKLCDCFIFKTLVILEQKAYGYYISNPWIGASVLQVRIIQTIQFLNIYQSTNYDLPLQDYFARNC